MRAPKGTLTIFGDNAKSVSTGDDRKISGGEVEFCLHIFHNIVACFLSSNRYFPVEL